MRMETGAVQSGAGKINAVSELRTELTRLGCGFRDCGFHGLIFAPRNTGGFNFEHGLLHYWDLGVNVYLNWDRAHERLASLPNNAGQAKALGSLLEVEPE